MRVAVIGVGGTGSAACRHLAKSGHQVVGYERFRAGHARGSSHGESRIIRYTYPDLLYTQMMADAYPLWADLEREAGEELFVRCGGVYIGAPDRQGVRESRAAMEAAGVPFEELRSEAMRARFPAFRLEPGEVALFQKDSGFLRATRCVRSQAQIAQAYGAELREETTVAEIATVNGKPAVRTEHGDMETFDAVIVTAGAWMGTLLQQLGLPLSVERRQVIYLDIARNPRNFAPERFPVWIDDESLYYGFPQDGVHPGVKLASHVLGQPVNPDTDEREPEPEPVAEAIAIAARRFPDLSPTPTHTQVCLYTNTPTEDFILDAVPDLPNVYLVSGCSGHGFKFTALLGKIAADYVTGNPYHRDLTRFALHKFRSTK